MPVDSSDSEKRISRRDKSPRSTSLNRLLSEFRLYSKVIKRGKSNGKCIVWDLDETLLRTFDKYSSFKKLNLRHLPLAIRMRIYVIKVLDDSTGSLDPMWGILRDYAREIMIYCLQNFDLVVIWTAGIEHYAYECRDVLFHNLEQPDLTYHRGHCAPIKELIDGKLRIIDYYKPLEKMIQQEKDFLGVMRLDNTVVIDNRPETFKENAENGIAIPDFWPSYKEDHFHRKDTALKDLMNFFDTPEFRDSKDVRKLDKKNIFSRSTINDSRL